jgi:predicted small metal-binding protein
MAKVLRCGELMPGCKAVIEGKDVTEVMAKGAEHAKKEHGMATSRLIWPRRSRPRSRTSRHPVADYRSERRATLGARGHLVVVPCGVGSPHTDRGTRGQANHAHGHGPPVCSPDRLHGGAPAVVTGQSG